MTFHIIVVCFIISICLFGDIFICVGCISIEDDQKEYNLPILPKSLPSPKDLNRLVNKYVKNTTIYDIWPDNKRVPRLLWMAVKDINEDMPPHIDDLMSRNHGWLPQVCDNKCKDDFIDTVWAGTSVQWAYHEIAQHAGAFKADIWRYAVLYTYGGMYIDDDSDIRTPFDEIVLSSDTLIMSEEGATSLGPCYVSDYHLSAPALYRRYIDVFKNRNYDKDGIFYQGLKESDGTVITPDVTAEERAYAALHTNEYIVPLQLTETYDLYFFHGNTLINWCIFSAPRHPLFLNTLKNLVEVIRSGYIGKSYLHVAKWEAKHKIGLCSTMFLMTYTLQEMLLNGSFMKGPPSVDSKSDTAAAAVNITNNTVINNNEWVPRISVRDFKEYGGKCKAIWTGNDPSHYSKKFKTNPNLLKSLSFHNNDHKQSLCDSLYDLNGKAVMKNEGNDRGIYYISNQQQSKSKLHDRTNLTDNDCSKMFFKHGFGDMDTLHEYGYVNKEIKHVHYNIIDSINDGVKIISKQNLRDQMKGEH